MTETLTADEIAAQAAAAEAKRRRDRFIDIGTFLHGNRYASALAAGLGVSQVYVSHVATGRRNVTDDLENRLLTYTVATMVERKKMENRVTRHVGALSQELGNLAAFSISNVLPVGETIAPDDEPDNSFKP